MFACWVGRCIASVLASRMEDSDSSSPEHWAMQPAVQQLLAAILAAPRDDHSTTVAKQLPSELLDAHVASLFRYVIKPRLSAVFDRSFCSDGGIALHCILYHLLWRSEWKVRPPPLDSTRASVELCHGGRLKASAHRDAFYPALSKAQGKANQGDCSALLQLRSKPFDPTTHSNLKLGSTLGNRPTASECQPSQVRMVVLVRVFCYG